MTQMKIPNADSPLAEAAREILSDIGTQSTPTDGLLNALAMTIADAILATDVATLDLIADGLHREVGRRSDEADGGQRDFMRGMGRVVQWARQRLPANNTHQEVAADTLVHKFLARLAQTPGVTNRDLYIRYSLAGDETAISRAGRFLLQRGLAKKWRVAQSNHWQITPKGRAVLDTVGFPNASTLRN